MQQKGRPQPSAVMFPTEEEISALAYQLFLSGRAARPGDYWRLAETELLERAAKAIPRVPETGPKPSRPPKG
jgi:hypothetical protein